MHQITPQQWNELDENLKSKFQEAVHVHYEDGEYPEYNHIQTYLSKFEDRYVLEPVGEGGRFREHSTDINSLWREVKTRLKEK